MSFLRTWLENRRARTLANDIIRDQVLPQIKAEVLRQQGVDVETMGVYTGPPDEESGNLVEVICIRCRRKGLIPPETVPKDKLVMCGRCMAGIDRILEEKD